MARKKLSGASCRHLIDFLANLVDFEEVDDVKGGGEEWLDCDVECWEKVEKALETLEKQCNYEGAPLRLG